MRRHTKGYVLAFGIAVCLTCGCGGDSNTTQDNSKADINVLDVQEKEPAETITDTQQSFDIPDPLRWYWDGIDVSIEDAPDGLEDPDDGSSNCPGGPYCSCEDNTDCDSGFCVLGCCGWQCLAPCLIDDSCEPGWKCAAVPVSGGDVAYGCVEVCLAHCKPCKAHDDCVNPSGAELNLCIELGPQGSFCGSPCSSDMDCPSGFECLDTGLGGPYQKQCVPLNGADCQCTQEFIDMGFVTNCYVENEFGKCWGERTCDAECDAQEPQEEICNGIDDNCDGNTDGGFPEECWNPDKDKDGILDEDDNCPLIYNPNQADCDDDGQGDACDPCNSCDDIPDGNDNCPCVPNLTQEDLDGDGMGDACDCDIDSDGVPNENPGCPDPVPEDNCPFDINPGQEEGCTFPYGAACDPDIDCDGIINEEDNCPYTFNPAQADCNSDGIGDACDPVPLNEECNGLDDDCDGITDEENAIGCSDYFFDQDQDGWGTDNKKCLCYPTSPYTANEQGDCNDTDPQITNCDDDDPCTEDFCDPETGLCEYEFVNCCDGDPCTLDYCDPQSGCVSKAPVCDSSSMCDVEAFDPETGECVVVFPLNCDDKNLCTIDGCDPETGECTHVPVICDDGCLCTLDWCDPETGLCVFEPIDCGCNVCEYEVWDSEFPYCYCEPKDCNDNNPCTIDSCDLLTGNCLFIPKDCDDGDACTVGDTCVDGQCVPGAEMSCEPGRSCVQGVCVCDFPTIECGDSCVDTQTDPLNCGGCGEACTLPNTATYNCVQEECEVKTCVISTYHKYANCNGIHTDGCEKDLSTDTNNCGSCFDVCNLSHTDTHTCYQGDCRVSTCDPHYHNCNGTHSDGCEVDLGYWNSSSDNRVQNTCATAVDGGSVCGDDFNDVQEVQGTGTKWVKFRVDECSDWDKNLSFAASLNSSEGGYYYDLQAREGSCIASLDGKGACDWDCVDDDWSDGWGQDDDKWIYVLVHHVTGQACSPWTLRGLGFSFCSCN